MQYSQHVMSRTMRPLKIPITCRNLSGLTGGSGFFVSKGRSKFLAARYCRIPLLTSREYLNQEILNPRLTKLHFISTNLQFYVHGINLSLQCCISFLENK